ncbi:hypothetical protein AN189_04615 [Loktanella sp. 3ANDIMAR09]|uniref:DUF2852 domain-containing protein n=1 Tax=Loktanella sp. 3ANDIMAR09 TaxID=1225657 RepID=UPI0006F2E740|nr:DUF2852 domain-containing protein [Loktanella sp. 3ANDIMAR09]KQI69677.1 hypothetical protein AN189_04615 [Loktanella sp. 3ANDIMAR09]
MTATNTYPVTTTGPIAWLQRAESWLDARGRGAWIAATVAAFIFVWPVGLALLAYMVFAGKFARGAKTCAPRRVNVMASSGNQAFDAYKADTLRRLQEEQDEFTAFLGRLREAKDKAEFDQFMADRGQTKDEEPSDKTA